MVRVIDKLFKSYANLHGCEQWSHVHSSCLPTIANSSKWIVADQRVQFRAHNKIIVAKVAETRRHDVLYQIQVP